MKSVLKYGFMQQGEDIDAVLAQYRAGTGLHDEPKGAIDEAVQALMDGTIERFSDVRVFAVEVRVDTKATEALNQAKRKAFESRRPSKK